MEKRPRLSASPPPSGPAPSEEVGVASTIKQSQLQLDDVPLELLPKHHENILKKVRPLHSCVHIIILCIIVIHVRTLCLYNIKVGR